MKNVGLGLFALELVEDLDKNLKLFFEVIIPHVVVVGNRKNIIKLDFVFLI